MERITNLIAIIEIEKKLNPKKLFLLDGFGAILSAFFLGIILVRFENFFGIPSETLYILAILPIFFACYDLYCFRKKNIKLSTFLKIIAILNLLYCISSIGFTIYHKEVITSFGWIYILIEILIIITISIIELKVAVKLNDN